RKSPKIFRALASVSKGQRKNCSPKGQEEDSPKVDPSTPRCTGTLTSPRFASRFNKDTYASMVFASTPSRAGTSEVSRSRIRVGLVVLAPMSITRTREGVDLKETGSIEASGEATKSPERQASSQERVKPTP
ncbi:hypothetical protein ACLOJK_034264, partial [Asimina triloba]